MSFFTNDVTGEPRVGVFFSLIIAVIISLVLFVALLPFTIVGQTERGIVLRNGALNRVLTPGLNFKLPLFETVVDMDVSSIKEEVAASAASKDLQDTATKVAINFQIDPAKVAVLYTEYQNEHGTRLVAPAIQEAVKAATAKYTAEELVTKREQVKSEIRASLETTLATHAIEVREVFITDFQFSEQFNTAVEAKVRAEQEAQQAKNTLERVKYEAEQKVAQAQAEAQSIRLQSDAANNPRFVELKRLEVQLEFAKKWNGNVPTNMYGSSPIPFVQVGSLQAGN